MTLPSTPAPASVLLVDDDLALLRVHSRVLARSFAVHTATSAEAALALIAAGSRFDAILCDLCLQGMSGTQLFVRLREADLPQAERFAILTGIAKSSEQEAESAAALGDRWLQKPLLPDQLLAAAAALTGPRR